MDPFEKNICDTLQKRKELAERIVKERSKEEKVEDHTKLPYNISKHLKSLKPDTRTTL